MKPRLARRASSRNCPCRSLRSAITAVMSTSLKVVSWAAVFCDSFRRSAMVLRSRVIGTRSSRVALGARAGRRGRRLRRGLAARDSRASSMSPLVTRPSRPVPATDAVGMPVSCGDALGRRHGGRVGLRAQARAWAPAAALAAAGLGASALRRPAAWRAAAGFAFGDGAQHRAHLHGGAGLDARWIQSRRRRARALPPSPCRFPVPAAARRG